MAVLGRVLISSAERVDLADLLSIDSYTAGDFKFLLKGLVGDTKPFILKGFDVIDPNNAIGTQSCSIKVADSMVFYPGSSTGSFYHGLEEGHAQAAPIVPELRKNATNFVYLTFSTFNSSVDTRAFWDPDKGGGAGGEFTQDVNTESVLKVDVNVSTGSFPANTIPIAKIVVGPVTIESITDCRDLMFRLGSGGISPDPFNSYQFRSLPGTGFKRTEPPITLLPGGVNPFQGADKNILSLKEWMDLVMTKLKEIGGSTYWYEDFSTYNLVNTFIDSLATTFKSKGSWTHDSSTPGLVTWTQDIQIKVTQDPRDIILRNGDKTLADEQVAYIPLIRAQVINASDSAVAFTNGQSYLNTVGGATGFFTNLSKGDWIKKIDDENHLFLRVEEFYDSVSLGGSTTTATNARSVRLNGIYQGTTLNEKARYDRGVYQVGDVVVSNRNDAALTTAGGNFHWLATRSDVIETAASLSTVTLTGTLSKPDGTTAKITSTAHGLQDGDRITITAPAAQAGTYVIEKETANIFYIPTTSLVTGAVTAFFGLVTTGARENGYGLQLENAVHEFETNDTVTIAGAVGYNGTYPISVRSSTQFQIAIGSAQATNVLATATATLARVNVRSEHGLVKIVQGGSATIGDGTSDNLKAFVGMASDGETYPAYAVPLSFDALDGMANYSALSTDSLTARASKLSAMMADKAQDKTIKYLASPSLITITNTTNGAAQEITFSSSGSTLTLITPGSDGQSVINLPSIAPGISLLTNESAYITIDRDNTTVPSIVIVSTELVPIAENIFVIASRLTDVEVYLWDSSIINVGSVQSQGFLDNVLRQNQMLKLVEGGTWSWTLGTQTVAWSASAFMQVPGLANTVNSIAAGSAILTSGQVAYVDINRVGPGGALTVAVASNATLTLTTDRIIIARRENNDVIVGNHSMRLISGETKKLYAATSDQTFTYIGSPDASDTTPDYNGAVAHTLRHITEGTSLTTGVARLDDQLDKLFGQLRMRQQTVANKRVIVTGADTTILDATTLSQQKSNLLLNFGGAQIDFETGSIFQSNGVTALGINFTPATIALNQYRWYSVTIIPSTVGSDNRIGGQILIIPAASDGASAALAPRASFGSGIKLGQVVVRNSGVASVITVILQTAITQLGSGSGGDDLPTPLKLSVPGNNRVITVGPITINVPADKNYIIPSINNIVPTFTGGVVTVPATSGTITTSVLGLPFYTNLGTSFDDQIIQLAVQSNGKIVAGGIFLNLNGTSRKDLIRLEADGTVDTAFYTNLGTSFNDIVRTVAIQTDGKILAGGRFTSFNGATRNRLVRLNADGTQDTAFYTNLGTGFNIDMTSVVLQTNGKILVGGDFTTFNGNSRNRLVRLNSDGTEDTAFYTNLGTGFNGNLYKVAVQTDGKILVCGEFTTLNGNTRNRLVRLNSDGTEDTAFYSNLGTGFDNHVRTVVIQSDGKILVGGDYAILNGGDRNRLVRLEADGTEDAAFYSTLTSAGDASGFGVYDIKTIAVQTDGKILVGGDFVTLNGNTRNRLVRLNSDGTENTAFYTALGTGAFNNTVRDVVLQSDNRILVGGSFTTQGVNTRKVLVRLEANGTEDAGPPGFALPFAMGASQYLKIGLHLTSAGAVVLSRGIVGASLAAATTAPAIPNTFGIGYTVLRTDGSSNVSNILSDDVYQNLGNQVEIKAVSNRYKEIALSTDPNFYTALGTGFNDTEVLATAVQTDGKILVGGDFTTLNDITRNRLVRLNSDGSVDTTFYTNLGTGFNNGIQAIAVQTDGKRLVGGQFTTFNGITRNRLVRLNSDGTHDAAFYTNLGTGFDNDIRVIAIQTDGKILVGGSFTTLNGNTRNYILRLNSDGTEDSAFYSNLPFGQGPNGPVRAIAIQTDGAIVVGGDFTQLFFFNRNYILRLNSDGTEDSAFYSSFSTAFDASVYTIKVQTDGKILVGGNFNILNGITRNRLVRLNTDGTEDTAFYTALGTGFNSSVYSIVLQTDGKILVGGGFTTLNAITRNVLVRLNSTGTVDTAFYTNLGTGFNLYARTITVQSNGKILFGGGFTTLNAITRNRLVRLNSDGTEDTTIAPFSALASTVLTLPKDTNSLVGTSVIASTVASSATVTITKVAHGLTTGDLVTVTTAVAIGGISAVNLSVTAVTIIALTTSTFTYTALATATTTTTGDLGRVIAKTTKSYIINDNSLEAYLNGILLYKGDEYSEIGAIGTQSNTVTALINFVAGDTLIFKIYD